MWLATEGHTTIPGENANMRSTGEICVAGTNEPRLLDLSLGARLF